MLGFREMISLACHHLFSPVFSHFYLFLLPSYSTSSSYILILISILHTKTPSINTLVWSLTAVEYFNIALLIWQPLWPAWMSEGEAEIRMASCGMDTIHSHISEELASRWASTWIPDLPALSFVWTGTAFLNTYWIPAFIWDFSFLDSVQIAMAEKKLNSNSHERKKFSGLFFCEFHYNSRKGVKYWTKILHSPGLSHSWCSVQLK